ncbi:plasmid maintenance system killer protein [Thiorhodovibrio frisius]|uniref:Plasmid maintenance system killer protein n=2 Tax=Thiorhodovibrio frisius TaxID=631362 RepID=H8Z7W2_9GAMM|nr:plasmid maintenance system killer protein [Thiorhodovibrio frisius]WPL22031.1 Toxin HigB-1 [Thiorhodovibrio frisius]
MDGPFNPPLIPLTLYFATGLDHHLAFRNASRYAFAMIKTFRCRDTETLFSGRRVARFANIERAALRKLVQLNLARVIDDMRAPPGNRLEALKGDRSGQWSVRINAQWRLCFRFLDGDALDVEIVDYH